jgi:hypothetical protein
MVELPLESGLPVECLAGCFKNVTNSYKFYWFLSILDHVRGSSNRVIPIPDLLTRMLAWIWYPTNYFRLSFGKSDRLGNIVLQVGEKASLPIDANHGEVLAAIRAYQGRDERIANDVISLGRYLPFRFLRPFNSNDLRGLSDTLVNARIRELAFQNFSDPLAPCLYRFFGEAGDQIEIQPGWFVYLRRNLEILRGFCLWHLVNYLQTNNPNVPNIASKLFRPEQRDLLPARKFWKFVFRERGEIRCIYSGQNMQIDAFSLDHFLPWSYVVHDQLWNIIPTPRGVNSSKSDSLPELSRYFDAFARLQYDGIQIVARGAQPKLLEDHVILLRVSSAADVAALSFETFQEKLRDAITPQYQIAANMGFPGHWTYA